MKTIGAELSVDLFSPVTWTAHSAMSYAGADYPFLRPEGSWRLDCEGELHGLDPAGSCWRDRDTGEHVDLAGRRFVLAYGSNGNPEKLAENLGTAIAIRCAVRDHAAVWCGERRREGSVVATLAADPGHTEVHHVLAVTSEDLVRIDRWEGHPHIYRRQTMPTGSVFLESGVIPHEVLVYIGTEDERPALRVDGEFWRTADHSYDEVDEIVP